MIKKTLFLGIIILLLAACGPSDPEQPDGENNVSTPVTTTDSEQPAASTESTDAYPVPNSGYPAEAGNSAYPAQERTSSGQGETDPTQAIPEFPGKIAFHSDRLGPLGLYVLDGATGDLVQLPTDGPQAYEPYWIPGCRSLVYAQDLSSGDTDIYLYNTEDNSSRPFLVSQRIDTKEWAATWSLDGTLLAYQSNPNTMFNVCFADNLGNDLGCLASNNFSNAHPDWFPDNNRVVFASNRDGDWDIYAGRLDNPTEAVQITNNTDVDLHPQVSPSGEYIVYESNSRGNYEIYVMNADGSNVTQLTFSAGDDRDPVWMGNDQIVFTSYIDDENDWEIFMMNRDGSNLKRLTYYPADDKGPAWCSPAN